LTAHAGRGCAALFGALVCLFSPALSAAGKPTAQKLMPLDADICFARDYDAGHQKRIPAQRITQMRIGARAGWNVRGTRDLPYHGVTIALSVRERGSARVHTILGSCSDYEETNEPGAEPGLHCELTCEGDKLVIGALDAQTIVVRNKGLRTACGGASIAGNADAVFHLRRQPAAACRDQLTPLPADEDGINAALSKAREAR
jgi:hypothetical protein